MKSVLLTTMLIGLASHGSQTSTAQVWQRHIDAWNARDVSAIVADYSEDATIIVNNRLYQGRRKIAELFRNLFNVFDQAEEHTIDPAIVLGKLVYIKWRAKMDGVEFTQGTDTFVIEDGKILYQTITSHPFLF